MVKKESERFKGTERCVWGGRRIREKNKMDLRAKHETLYKQIEKKMCVCVICVKRKTRGGGGMT